MIKQLVESGKLYGYITDYLAGGKGVVLADNKKEAKLKVKQAYLKHGYSESELSDIDVWKISKKDNNFFEDSCDVLEVWE